MIEIVTIWFKIIGIICLWEAWKYLGWMFVNWWVERQVKKYENQYGGYVSKCPYLNSMNDEK